MDEAEPQFLGELLSAINRTNGGHVSCFPQRLAGETSRIYILPRRPAAVRDCSGTITNLEDYFRPPALE